MKLELTQKLQQQQILAPQMILSMDILLLPTQDLEQRIQKEFEENPALEMVDPRPTEATSGTAESKADKEGMEAFKKLEYFQDQPAQLYDYAPRRTSRSGDADSKHEALQNTAGRPPGLREFLTEQVQLKTLEQGVREIAENIINNLDHRGYLLCSPDELRSSMENAPTAEAFQNALQTVRSLDPPGVAAENLQECLMLQLERDPQEYPLEMEIIRNHLQDLGMNRIPKIAKDLGATISDIKEAVEIITSLDPLPGGRFEPEQTIYIRPDVTVELVDGKLEVRVDGQSLPKLEVSKECRELLKRSRQNREMSGFLRKKIESAQWLIQAIHQRQRTLHDIAVALVEYQQDFMIKGPEHLRALKMQTLADIVGVHISTISRAIKGKYMETPRGVFEMRYFFTGGVGNAQGELESRRNICRLIKEIIDEEDKLRPYSDTDLARILKERGLNIARRTVTKYREQVGVPSSRLRKEY